MMDSFMKPSHLDLNVSSTTASKEWKHWLKTFENYVEVLGQSLPEGRQIDKLKVLVNCVSHNVFEHIKECETYDAAIAILTNLYTSTKTSNEILARFLLATAKQGSEQSIDEFLLSLEKLAKDCNFRAVTAPQYKQEMVRDAFINGISSHMIREKLLENNQLCLETATQLAKELDLAQKNSNSYLHPQTSDGSHSPTESMTHKTGYQEENISIFPDTSRKEDTTLYVEEKKSKKKKRLTSDDIGMPSDFKHVGHIDKGFDINTADPNIRPHLEEAGVSEKDIQDEKKRHFIYDFMERKGGMEAIRKDTVCRKPLPSPPVPAHGRIDDRSPQNSSLGSGLQTTAKVEPKATEINSPDPDFKLSLHKAGAAESQLQGAVIRQLISKFNEKKDGTETVEKEAMDTIGKNKNSPFSSHDRNYHHPRSRGSSFTPACPTGSSSHQFPPEQQQHQRHHSVPVPLPRKLLHSDPTSSNQTQPLPPQHLAPSVFSPSPTAPSTQREQEVLHEPPAEQALAARGEEKSLASALGHASQPR